MKAGLMEIADIFVVNKADRDGADKISRDIKSIITHQSREDNWDIPILLTTANKNEGINVTVESIQNHRDFQIKNNLTQEKLEKNREEELLQIIKEALENEISNKMKDSDFKSIVKKVRKGDLDPYEGAEKFISKLI